MVDDPIAYRYEYADGLKATIMLVEGIVHDITFAARLKNESKPLSTLMYLHPREVCNFFSPLVHHTETLFLTGKSPYPVERTLLTTGLTAAGVDSLHLGQKRLETPHLNIRYQPAKESTYWTSPNPAPVSAGSPVLRLATQATSTRKRIAVITTIWTYLSHSQHITDRFLVGYPIDGEWHTPEMDVVSLWVDQHPDGDQSKERAKEFGFKVYPSIAETLRCGGDELAVDAVLLIAEHGEYPSNKKGQKLYPRYEWFKEIVRVFEEDGRAVPVYNDKHLSYDFAKAQEMVADSKRLQFPMLAGSSIPVTWRLPELELPLDCEIEEVVMAAAGNSDAHDFHALEALQAMVERRKGGESGVKAVQLLQGDEVWKAGEDGRWSKEILEAALSRTDEMQGVTLKDARPQDLLGSGVLPGLVKEPRAYLIDRYDGLRTTLLWLNGAVGDFLFAAKLKEPAELVSTQCLRSPHPNVHYSAGLASNIEEMFATGRAPYPVERTLLVSGMLDLCLESMVRGNKRIETPELDVRYQVGPESHHCTPEGLAWFEDCRQEALRDARATAAAPTLYNIGHRPQVLTWRLVLRKASVRRQDRGFMQRIQISVGIAVSLFLGSFFVPIASLAQSIDAAKLHKDAIVIDGHVHIITPVFHQGYDPWKEQPTGLFDYVRAKKGGLDVVVHTVYIEDPYNNYNYSVKQALRLVSTFYNVLDANSDKMELALTSADVRRIVAKGKMAAILALEGGFDPEGDLQVLRMFYRLGVRMIQPVSHNTSNTLMDAGLGLTKWGGLTEQGRKAVAEMNRLGILIDVSHATDEAQLAIIAASRAPVVGSHHGIQPQVRWSQSGTSTEVIRSAFLCRTVRIPPATRNTPSGSACSTTHPG